MGVVARMWCTWNWGRNPFNYATSWKIHCFCFVGLTPNQYSTERGWQGVSRDWFRIVDYRRWVPAGLQRFAGCGHTYYSVRLDSAIGRACDEVSYSDFHRNNRSYTEVKLCMSIYTDTRRQASLQYIACLSSSDSELGLRWAKEPRYLYSYQFNSIYYIGWSNWIIYIK